MVSLEYENGGRSKGYKWKILSKIEKFAKPTEIQWYDRNRLITSLDLAMKGIKNE